MRALAAAIFFVHCGTIKADAAYTTTHVQAAMYAQTLFRQTASNWETESSLE